MNFLREIEGLSKENLTTAVLRILILRSQEVRDELIRLISTNSPIGPLKSESLFSCYKEQTVSDNIGDAKGRLDLVIEIDDAVVGIENKFYANFQPEQIERYLKGLAKAASERGKIWGKETKYLLVVIGPEVRKDEIRNHLKDYADTSEFITWEDVLNRLGETGFIDDEAKVIQRSLKEFVNDRISFLPTYNKWYPHIRRRFEPRGTMEQKEFLRGIWRFFSNGGNRMFGGNDWVGYDIKVNGNYAWFGFVRTSLVKNWINDRTGEKEAELIIGTTFPVYFHGHDIEKCEIRDEKRWWPWLDTRYFWKVRFDESW